MRTTGAHLAELTDDLRQMLETWLVEFDLSWDENRLGLWVHRLPPRGDRLRRPALIEMLKIDLERRWQRGQRVSLENYLSVLPELGAPDRLPADLVLAEFEARQQCGSPADLAEFAQRFPRQADQLRRLVRQSHGEAAERASLETTRLGDHGTDAGGCTPPNGLPVSRSPGATVPDLPTPHSSGPARGDVRLPERFGRYRILRELGRGAMGTVYLAHDSQLDRRVALKVPQFTAADGPEVRQRFLSEGRAAATIEHPNVCPVYDVGEIDGTPYLTMAYLRGRPLAQLLEGPAPLSGRQAASLVRQLTVALQAAHERGIVHRDLKPSNIMINERGEPVILDFGLARRLHQDSARLTRTGQPLGTPAYMSPEQAGGAVQVMGPGCDIFALGVILYQLLTGRLPFEGSVAEVLCQIVARQPVPPLTHRPDLDPRLEAICLKALSKKVGDRYASMGDFGAALTDYLRCEPPPAAVPVGVSSAAPTPVGRDARPRAAWLGRKRLWLLVATAGVAAVGAATAAVLVGVVFWVVNSTGTIRVELAGPPTEVEVQVDGERVENGRLNEPLRLRPGKHHMQVTGKKIQPVSSSFTVARGDNPVLKVQLIPRADAAADPAPPAPVPPRRKSDDDRKERDDDWKERKDRDDDLKDRKERDDDWKERKKRDDDLKDLKERNDDRDDD
jgi:hypothetical protein